MALSALSEVPVGKQEAVSQRPEFLNNITTILHAPWSCWQFLTAAHINKLPHFEENVCH